MAGTSPAMTAIELSDERSFRRLLRRRVAGEVDDRERGADALGGAVLEADHGVDRNVARAAIDIVDDRGVLLVDDAAADFSRAR